MLHALQVLRTAGPRTPGVGRTGPSNDGKQCREGEAEHDWDGACAITFWHDPEERTLIFYAATLLFLANFALGVLVQFGIVDTRPFRWLHHALFFAVFASAGLAVLIGFWQGAPYRWVLVPVLGLYLILPRVRAGTPGHAALALAAMVLYAAGFARTIQGV